MANSGTYTFNPPIGSLALNAFARCQVKRTELTPQHMEDAYLETNLMQSDWSADNITFWNVQLITQTLTQGTATYDVPANAITVLDVYISIGGTFNRLLFPFSRTDYASLAIPNQQGFPTSFWQDRLLTQTLTLWPVPDGNATYVMSYYIYTQPQDATIRQGGNAAIPYYWLDAYVAGLAHRLSRIYAPALEAARKIDAQEAYAKASKQAEMVPLYITPGMAGYFTNRS
jgi:hypothetical protein